MKLYSGRLVGIGYIASCVTATSGWAAPALTGNRPTRQPALEANSASQLPSTTGILPGEAEFNSCLKIPAKRRFKLRLKPESDITELIHLMSSVTCRPFLVANPSGLA